MSDETIVLTPQPEVVITLPGPDAPGFMRRQRRCQELRAALRTATAPAAGVAAMEAMVAWLTQFVTTPADPQDAREALLDLSKQDYDALLQSVAMESDAFLPSHLRTNGTSAGGTTA